MNAPCFMFNDSPGCCLRNSIALSKIFVSSGACRIEPSDFLNFGPSQLSAWMRFWIRLKHAVATFAHHVLNIVVVGSYKQMKWITTRWIVAVVKYAQSFLYGAVNKCPGCSMGAANSSLNVLTYTVSLLRFTTSPIPALILGPDFNSGPKQCWEKQLPSSPSFFKSFQTRFVHGNVKVAYINMSSQ